MAGLRIKLLTRYGIWSPACRLQSTAHACVVRSAKLVASAYATAAIVPDSHNLKARYPMSDHGYQHGVGLLLGEGTIGQLDTWAAAISAKACPADCAPDRSSVAMPSVSAR
jgi:hypothetical protein